MKKTSSWRLSHIMALALLRCRPKPILLVTAALLVASLCVLSFLVIDADFSPDVSGIPESEELIDVGNHLGSGNTIAIALASDDPFSASSFEALDRLHRNLLVFNAQWLLQSVLDLSLPSLADGELGMVPLAPDARTARANLAKSPLLSSLFLSDDGLSWIIVLTLKDGNDPEIWFPELTRLKSDYSGLHLSGIPWLEVSYHAVLAKNFIILLSLAEGMLFFLYVVLLRSPVSALLLWAASTVPTVMLCAVFSVSGTALGVYTLLAPFLTLALSTSYAMHLFYGWSQNRRDLRSTIQSRGPVILLDALTTLLGFASLFLSPVRQIRPLGLFTIIGVCISLLTTFFVFTAFLRVFGMHIPLHPEDAGLQKKRSASRQPVRWVPAAILFGFILLLTVPGLRSIQIGYDVSDMLLPWSEQARDLAFLEQSFGSLDEIIIEIDSGTEGSLGTLEEFRRIQSMQQNIAALHGVRSVLGYVDLVSESLRNLYGTDQSSQAQNDADVAETLELAGNNKAGTLVSRLIDPAWGKTWISVRLDHHERRPPIPGLVGQIKKLIHDYDLDARLGGRVLLQSLMTTRFVADQAFSLGVLFVGYVVLLSLVFRSIRLGLLSLIPSLFSIMTILGLMGLLGWKLNNIHAVAFAAIAGISVDSSIMFLMIDCNPATNRALRDATFLLCTALFMLVFSSFFNIVQTALLCILGLIISLFGVFYFLGLFKR
ncbi:MAG: hypothetical protein A2Z96_07580 [Spirochaetes bacterium GWB1_48_6]|nr:MAG: hypothetical protein A2Z96_07580 [Spirochaetes bacterium GWB1_48_6]